MLLILRSSAASSRLIVSFMLSRLLSSGASPDRGWRWPTGACTEGRLELSLDEPILLFLVRLCASALASPATIRIASAMISFFILLLPSSRQAFPANIGQSRGYGS